MSQESMSQNSTNQGSDQAIPAEMLIELLPEEIVLNPSLNVRMGVTGDEEADTELYESIKVNGQLEPVKVRRMGNGDGQFYELVFGGRRHEAVQRINLEAEAGVEPLKVKCIVAEVSDDDALRQAIAENMKRKNHTAIGDAMLIGKVREQFNWKGTKGGRKVAEFMGKSPAWVHEREKLLALDDSTKAKIQSGELSAEAALMLPAVAPELREAVIGDAKKRQAAEKANGKGKGKGKSNGAVSQPDAVTEQAIEDAKKPEPVAARHVAAAIRESNTGDEPTKTKALKAKDLVGFFEGFVDGVPYLYETVQDFLRYFVQKYAKGKGTERTMEAKFKALILPMCKGARCEPQTIAEIGDAPMPKSASKSKKPTKQSAAKKPAVKSRKKSSK